MANWTKHSTTDKFKERARLYHHCCPQRRFG